jgi:5-methylcytosine-specific restriction endonuclease McrA
MGDKKSIPRRVRNEVWLKHNGRRFESKCKVAWCKTVVNVFDFVVGHNVPESSGGPTDLSNLFPICSACNAGMGDKYTIDEFSAKFRSRGWFCCLGQVGPQ